ncbi:MAG: hypothetical protein L0Z50_12650, partial [Verrucomicrobiales bacterium]|nr:hypothetical protein [Verrucomicrobiales bacterium]
LPVGLYRAVMKSSMADLAGNRLTADYTWAFRVADAVFWTRHVDGSWNQPLNWTSGAIPGADDHVVIDAFGADVTVTYAVGTSRIKSLIANQRVQLTPGILQIAEDIQLNQDLSLDGGSIQGGTVTQNGGAKLLFTNRSGTLDGVTVNGDLALTNAGARLVIRNGLTLNGSVLLDNGAAIGFVGDQTFDTGNVVFAGNSGSLNVDGTTTLTLGPAMVVRGKSGFIGGSGFPKLINRGLIATDVAGGALTIATREFENAGTIQAKDNNALTINSPNWSNGGRIEVARGGTLTMGGTWTNRGTIDVTDATLSLGGRFTLAGLGAIERAGSMVEITGELDLNGGPLTLDAQTGPWVLKGGTIKRGTVTQTGGAKLIFTNSRATFDDVRVNGDLELTGPGTRLLILNELALAGTATVDNGSALGFAGDQIFNTGSVVFAGKSGSPGWLSIEGNTTLTLGPAMVVRGKTGIIGTGLFQPRATHKLINQGLISADVAGGALTVSLDQFENTGTIAATAAGSTITIRANPFLNTGTIQELNGVKVLINP